MSVVSVGTVKIRTDATHPCHKLISTYSVVLRMICSECTFEVTVINKPGQSQLNYSGDKRQ